MKQTKRRIPEETMIQGRGHGRYEPAHDVRCRLPTEKSFLPARGRGQDLLFHHRLMEREASSALANLAYRNSSQVANWCKYPRLQFHTHPPHRPQLSKVKSPTSKHHSLAVVCLGRSSGHDDASSLQRHPLLHIFASGWAWQCKKVK